MRKYFYLFLLLTAFFSHAQHGFFRANNNYVAPATTSTHSNALDFDGIDDYVNCGINPSLNLVSSMTIELWIKPNQEMGNGKWDRLVHRDWPSGYFFGGKNGATNALAVVLSGDLNAAVTPNNTIDVGVWQHVGFVFDDPANNIKIYKNGTLISDSTWNGTISGNPNSLLTLSQSSETFNGAMDDVRIWNIARTQSEIQSNMNTELAGTETGLVAYYPFNQGVAAGDNTAIISAIDKTSNALNGTLTNFARIGTTSNFVVGKVNTIINGSTPSQPSPVLTGGLVLNLDAANLTSYSGTGSTWTDISGASNNMSLFNGVSFDSSNQNSILFDGVNDYVGKNTAINTGQDFTISVWMYATLLGNTRTSLVANSYNYSSGNGWFFCTDAGGTNNSFFLSIGNDYPVKVSSSNSISLNTWNYLTAVVKSGGRYIDLYKNGILISGATTDLGASTINYNYANFSIGFRDPAGTTDPFHGNIGSTQIYNRILTADEVLQNFNTTKLRYGL